MQFNSTTAIVFGLGLMAVSYMLLRMTRARAAGPRHDPREQAERLRERSDIQMNLERLVVDIQEITRTNIATLDTKMRLMQQLIADADARIKKLEAHSGATTAPPAPSLHQRVFDLADRGLDAHHIGRELNIERGEVELILGLRKVKPDS